MMAAARPASMVPCVGRCDAVRMVIDVWMQHPTLRFLRHDMFASLRRWTGRGLPEEEPPIEMTVPRWITPV